MTSEYTVSLDESAVSVADESSTTDSLTTDEYFNRIEYNTRMTSEGIAHIFITMLVLLGAMGAWIVLKRWYFGGV